MNSPLKELEQIQKRQIEQGYYQNDTEEIKQILNSIKMIAYENIYKKQIQQPTKLDEEFKHQDENEIIQYYRNQYKSIDMEERFNLKSRIINKKIIEYQNRNTPRNYKMGLPSLRNSENISNSLNKGTKHVVNPQTERGRFQQTKTLLNKTMQQTFNDFTQQWIKNENQNSPSLTKKDPKIKKGQSIFLDEITTKAQSIIQSATINKKLRETLQNSRNSYTPNNIRDQQLAITSIQLGNLSFQVPKCNKFLVDQELRILRSRIANKAKPNILVVDQRRMQI
ncbi:unnamed protein product [Paramecium sonneborni]|uniref:Uncharacterized protein n=1 Tax=Paramecium sonneborni TaxID=65129 RepID=A0A8S1PUX0_9CILI|nr:unnamed protein product [Paramecium sonneborni]